MIKSPETCVKSRYGCCIVRPSSIQFLNTVKWYVVWHCIFGFLEGFVVRGVINIIIITLEKRYGLSSQRSGMISSANDFGSAAVFILVGFLGTHANKPRLMGIGFFVMSLGCLVFVSPHFVGGLYEYTLSSTITNSTGNLCFASNSSDKSCLTGTNGVDKNDLYYALLIIGNALIGVGSVPVFILGLTYIEENSRTRDSPFYFGCVFGVSAVGAAVGYIAGAQTLSIFVDIDKIDSSSLTLDPSSPQWVGAWWIGVLTGIGGFLLVLFPISGFPKRLPGYDEIQKERVSEVQTNMRNIYKEQENFGKSIKHLPKSVWLLLKNPAFLFIVLGGTVEIFLMGGISTFGAKLFTEYYHINITEAGYIMGVITVFGTGGGMMFGGYIVKRLDLRCRGIIRFICACMFLCILFGPAFLTTCPSPLIAGVSTTYPDNSESSMISSCNVDCGCTTVGFEPVCDENQIVYFSPCHAGCSGERTVNGTMIYQYCSCINSTIPSVPFTTGKCSERCIWFYVTSVLLFFMMFLTFCSLSPGLTAMYRCIPNQQRALGAGIQFTFGRLLGSTPGPIFLGAILDSTCMVWQETCGERGTCWVYDKWPLGVRLMIWWMGTKFLGVIFLLIASVTYKPENIYAMEMEIKKQENYEENK